MASLAVASFVHLETQPGRAPQPLPERNSNSTINGGGCPDVDKGGGPNALEKEAPRRFSRPAYRFDYSGEVCQIRHESSSLAVTLGFALVLIYLVLAAQFSSFRLPAHRPPGSVPLAISGSLLFATSGGRRQHLLAGRPLSPSSASSPRTASSSLSSPTTLQEQGLSKVAAAQRGRLHPPPPHSHDKRGDGLRLLPAGAGDGRGTLPKQHRHRAGGGMSSPRSSRLPVPSIYVLLAKKREAIAGHEVGHQAAPAGQNGVAVPVATA